MTAPAHEKPAGVSSIELFFDLVFVFVITQVTQLVGGQNWALLGIVIAARVIAQVPGEPRLAGCWAWVFGPNGNPPASQFVKKMTASRGYSRRGRACGENVMVTEHGTRPPRAVLVTEVGPLVELQQYGGLEHEPQ